MKRFEIDINLEHIKEQRQKWNEAARAFSDAVDTAMTRLIHEGAALRMSHTEVARKSGFTSHQIKTRMKAMGLNPSSGKTLLSKQAASVLEHNAEIMGIQPHEIDLMSPLAYLPAGPALKHEVSDVHELIDDKITLPFPKTNIERLTHALNILYDKGEVIVTVEGELNLVRVDLNADDQPVLTEYGLSLLVKAAQQGEVGA